MAADELGLFDVLGLTFLTLIIYWVWHVIIEVTSFIFRNPLRVIENKPINKDEPIILLLKSNNNDLGNYKSQNAYECENSGYDLYVPEDVTFQPGETKFIDYKISCEMVDNGVSIGYFLFPRSSISKTPLMLCNSVGIIDAGYRGPIISALRYVPDGKAEPYVLKKGTRVVQICSPYLCPFHVMFAQTLSNSKRGSGGFGSTGVS